jgi:hypothetical protein
LLAEVALASFEQVVDYPPGLFGDLGVGAGHLPGRERRADQPAESIVGVAVFDEERAGRLQNVKRDVLERGFLTGAEQVRTPADLTISALRTTAQNPLYGPMATPCLLALGAQVGRW